MATTEGAAVKWIVMRGHITTVKRETAVVNMLEAVNGWTETF